MVSSRSSSTVGRSGRSASSSAGSDSEPDSIAIDCKIMAVEDQTDFISKCQDEMLTIQQQMCDYKRVQADRMAQMREKVTELAQAYQNTCKRMVSQTLEELKAIDVATAPYRNGPKSATESAKVTDKCINMLGKIAGLEATIKKTAGLSAVALKHHYELNRIEKRQAEAVRTHEQLNRVLGALADLRNDEQLVQIAEVGRVLMALRKDARISDHYKRQFETIQQHVCELIAEIRIDMEPVSAPSVSMSISSMSNGEIGVNSLQDMQEIPPDSLMSAVS